MSADLSDPQILPTYSSIVRNDPTNWLLLTYGKTRDKLSLFSTGTGGIEELANHLTDDDVYFAFVREDKAYVIISYFPAGIPGVRRARAMVHSRAVTSLFKVAATTYAATSREQVGTNQVRAKLGLPPIAGIARGFMSQGPASLPANSESMPVYQNAAAAGRVGSPTTRADSPGGGRAPAGYNNARRTESPLLDSSRIPRPGQQQGGGGSRKPLPRNAFGYPQGQALAPPPTSGSRISDAPSFEMDGKASYYAPGMQVDSRENSTYDPGARGVYEREREMGGGPRTEMVYNERSEHYARDPRDHQSQSRNRHPNSRFSPPPVHSTGGHIPSQDRDLPLPPLPSQDDNEDEEEFEVIPGAEDVNGFPDIPTPTGPTQQSLASLISSNSPPPVPRKSTDSYGKSSALSSDSGLGLPRDSTDSMSTYTSGTGGHMQSSLFRTEAQELRARWAAQEQEKEEREQRQLERERELDHKTTGSGSGFGFGSIAARPSGRYFDRRKESVGTNTSSTGTSSEVHTPIGVGHGIARESLYMSEGDSAYGYGSSTGTGRKKRGRTKSMIAREREREEQEMARAAAEVTARKKWEKAQLLRDEMEEEERKKAEYEEAARRRAAERLRREQIRRAEEERERLEAEAKKQAQQERRVEEARKAEVRRRDFQRREEEARLREEERKQRATEERAKRMREIQERFDKLRETSDVLLTGFLTVQAGNTVVWRRRYFQLMGDRMTLHRNAEETFKILENIDLNGTIKAIKEWEQGYDELRAIPHSWAIEFTNDAPWQFYADSEEDKDVLISLLTQVSISSAW